MFNPEDLHLEPDTMLVFRDRTHNAARLHLPVAGKIITQGLDVSMAELRACDEIIEIAKRHRRPPKKVIQEMKKRFYQFFMQMERIKQHHYAESN